MGYESRIFVVNRRAHLNSRTNTIEVYAEKIADIKMSKMRVAFSNLFTETVDYDLFIDNEDEPTSTDMYGDTMTYTDKQTVIDYLEKIITEGDNYRRNTLLLGLLKGIDESQWDEIQIVHYGY